MWLVTNHTVTEGGSGGCGGGGEDLFGMPDEVDVVLLRGRAACVSTAGGGPRPQSADAALDKRELQKRAISLQDFPLEPGSARKPVSLIPPPGQSSLASSPDGGKRRVSRGD